jgi:tetratricopeptide (TPR) repeat protein
MNAKNLLYCGVFIFGLISCNNSGPKDTLHSPPFAGITDSISRFPSNTELLLRRAQLLSQNNQHELAYFDYKLAWEKNPTEETALAYVANLYLVNKPGITMPVLEEATKKFPTSAELRRRLSEAYLHFGMGRKAMDQYDDMLRNDSLNFETWYEKGMLLAEMKDTAAALRAFEKSYSIQPLTINGLPLANLYAESKNPNAIRICDELIRKDSTGAIDPLYIKGIYYSNTNENKLAIEQFEECIKKDWKFTDAYIEKGIVLYEMNNIDEALQTFKLASTISPRNADTYYWQGRCFEKIGKNEDAMDNYIRAYSLDRELVEAKEHIDNLNKNHK